MDHEMTTTGDDMCRFYFADRERYVLIAMDVNERGWNEVVFPVNDSRDSPAEIVVGCFLHVVVHQLPVFCCFYIQEVFYDEAPASEKKCIRQFEECEQAQSLYPAKIAGLFAGM